MVLDEEGYPTIVGLTRGRKIPYPAPLPPPAPPPPPHYAAAASFAASTTVFDPLLAIALQHHALNAKEAAARGEPAPPLPQPAASPWDAEAAAIGPHQAAAKLTLFFDEALSKEAKASASGAMAVAALKATDMTLAELEDRRDAAARRAARAEEPPLLWRAYTLCGEVSSAAGVVAGDF